MRAEVCGGAEVDLEVASAGGGWRFARRYGCGESFAKVALESVRLSGVVILFLCQSRGGLVMSEWLGRRGGVWNPRKKGDRGSVVSYFGDFC